MPSHRQTYHSYYSVQQLYAVVADVPSYPDFLPWVKGCRVHKESESAMVAELLIAFKAFRGSYVSDVSFGSPDDKGFASVDVLLVKGPFKTLVNEWKFYAQEDGATKIEFYVEFEFKSKILDKMLRVVFDHAVMKMMQSFEGRAISLYG